MIVVTKGKTRVGVTGDGGKILDLSRSVKCLEDLARYAASLETHRDTALYVRCSEANRDMFKAIASICSKLKSNRRDKFEFIHRSGYIALCRGIMVIAHGKKKNIQWLHADVKWE